VSRDATRRSSLLGALGLLASGLGVLALSQSRSSWPGPARSRALVLPLTVGPRSVGKPLPDLVLVDHEGRALTLGALRGRPVWLAFLRGAYCAYCREQLVQLRARAAEVARSGVQLIAVTPDPPAISARLRRELALPFPFLSDPGEQAVTALCGGLAHCQLLVDPEGMVRWTGASESWSESPAPEALLETARWLGSEQL